MLTVTLAVNPFLRDTWETFNDVTSLPDFITSELMARYPIFPDTVRIYKDAVNPKNDITPATPEAADDMSRYKSGSYYVVVWPAGQAIAIQMGVSLLLTVTAMAIKQLLPKDEKATPRRVPRGSPNNFPGIRQNQARVLERIPDIYGRVKSTPDLLQAPYIRYEDNHQIELSYMCIGQGEYTIDADDVKEGDTKVSSIIGSSVAIYPPGEVPGSGTPQLEVGTPLTDPLYNVIPIREVVGETLLAPNNKRVSGEIGSSDAANSGPLADNRHAPLFEYVSTGVGTITFFLVGEPEGQDAVTQFITEGDKFGMDFVQGEVRTHPENDVEGAGGAGNRPALGLLAETQDDPHYEVISVDTSSIDRVVLTISVPVSIRPEWEKIAVYNPGPSVIPVGTVANRAFQIYVLNFVQGPFFVNDPLMEEIHLNVVAPGGLWQDDGSTQRSFGLIEVDRTKGVRIYVNVWPADENANIIGPREQFTFRILGSDTRRDLIGVSEVITPSFTGRFIFEAYRATLTPIREHLRSYKGPSGENNRNLSSSNLFGQPYNARSLQIQDEIQLTHAYSMSKARYPFALDPIEDFGNITTVHCRRVQRKQDRGQEPEKRLNIIVQRNLALYDPVNEEFSSDLFPTGRGVDALFDVLRSPTLGNLPDSQIDFNGIHAAFKAVDDSFVDGQATAFHHTFDGKDTALEDIIAAIAESCFVTVYRQGDIIKAIPDISTQEAALLFNHRNKVPGSETRTETFGTEEEYDGIEVEFVSNNHDQLQLYTIPAQGIPRNAQKIRVAGVRTKEKAAMHAWRAYHELQNRVTLVEFESYEAASLGLINERILVSDNTHPNTMDGEIIAADGEGLGAWQFDGVDDSVQMGNFLSFERTDSRTWSFWITMQPGSTGNVFTKYHSSNPNGWAVQCPSGGAYRLFLGTNTPVTNQVITDTSSGFDDGLEHHVVITYSGTSTAAGVSFYVDNILQAKIVVSDTLSSTMISSAPLQIGGNNGSGSFGPGTIRHISMWTGVLSNAQRSELSSGGQPTDLNSTSMAASLLGWWKLDNTDTTAAGGVVDHGPSGIDGTAVGGLEPGSSLVLYTSQEVSASGSSTLFLQGYEGTTVSIPVTQGPTSRSLTLLQELPPDVLYLDDASMVNTKYLLVRDDFPSQSAFRIAEKSQKAQGVYSIQAYNYTDAYYFYDGIRVYLPCKRFTTGFPPVSVTTDRSPYEWEIVPTGTTSFSPNAIRGIVYVGTTGSYLTVEDDAGLSLGSSYTIVTWLFINTAAVIARSNDSLNEVIFSIDSLTLGLVLFHDGVQYVQSDPVPSNEWFQAAVTYDDDTGQAIIYLNGVAVASASAVPAIGSFDGWRILQIEGAADSFRIYRKAQTAGFMLELYKKELMT